jgi:Fur family transcriptional regulator, ferric uptake regulator
MSEEQAIDAGGTLPGQRQTRQRSLVYEVINAASGPMTVHEIHAAVQQEMPRTGIATIYRAVKLLHDADMIQVVTLPSGETRYESAALGHHHHFQCERCGRVLDIDHCPTGLKRGTKLPGGYILHRHEITMFGLCPKCAAEEEA